VESRASAQRAIEEGRVEVDGIPRPKAATLVAPESTVKLRHREREFVSRGGIKLDGALAAFDIPVDGRRALDAGASTGGFTDCLLQRGAAAVTALDVGYGQLAWSLQSDERVTVLDRSNLRHVVPGDIGAPFDIVVADLSFISLTTVAPALSSCGGPATDYVLLVKPQFEVGAEQVGKGGIVRDPAQHAAALQRVAAGLDAAGLGTLAVIASSIAGAKGNREFLLWARPGPRGVDDAALAAAATQPQSEGRAS
jgi:23S rRNA (cytidine1920-2'-O)/16S rRNA (cytidine1409-2'-O)-methyltransferase